MDIIDILNEMILSLCGIDEQTTGSIPTRLHSFIARSVRVVVSKYTTSK